MKKFKARPFLKWAGGKRQLLRQFQDFYPQGLVDHSLTRYIEPFLGSGAVFIDIIQKFPITEAFLFDINKELILAFQVVQNEPEKLIECLKEQKQAFLSRDEGERKSYFYQLRERYNHQATEINFQTFSDQWIVRAAQMIFLNKTCYNGLYRVNKQGQFNVPFGSYKHPSIFNEKNINSLSQLLQKAVIRVGPYQSCRPFVNDFTFVYFDPPYRPLSSTSNFTSYSSTSFDDSDQKKLAYFFAELNDCSKAKLMLSNSDPRNVDSQDLFFQELYDRFQINHVSASRMINSKAKGRGKIKELLITNY